MTPKWAQAMIEAAGNMTYSSYLLHFPLQFVVGALEFLVQPLAGARIARLRERIITLPMLLLRRVGVKERVGVGMRAFEDFPIIEALAPRAGRDAGSLLLHATSSSAAHNGIRNERFMASWLLFETRDSLAESNQARPRPRRPLAGGAR